MRPTSDISSCGAKSTRTVLYAGLVQEPIQPFVEDNDVPFLDLLHHLHVPGQRRLRAGLVECPATAVKNTYSSPKNSITSVQVEVWVGEENPAGVLPTKATILWWSTLNEKLLPRSSGKISRARRGYAKL